MHNAIYSLTYDSDPPRIGETANLGRYELRAESFNWTEEELAHVRLVLRKLTALRIDNPEDAEDLVQETLLTMVRKAPGVDLEKGLLIWGMGILRKKVGNYYRKAQRYTSMDDQRAFIRSAVRETSVVPSPESSLHHTELCSMIKTILTKLSEPERQAIDLYLAGRQTCEIVSLLHPERYQNIVNRLHRGRKKLAKELARFGYARLAIKRRR